MRKIIKDLLIVLVCILLIGMITAFIDYLRIIDYKLPVFNVSSYNPNNKKQVFQGMLYTFTRNVRGSSDEELYDSSNLEFKLIRYDLTIPKKEKKDNITYKFTIEKDNECSSNLYYADLDKKVYTYCLSSIKLDKKELLSYLEKDKNIIDSIENSISYTGLYNKTMMFKDTDIKIYHCTNNDIYIGDINLEYMDDFCIDKDDDLKFIFEIKEETDDVDLKDEEEVFYEDEKYTYSFDKVKSDYIYITTPKNRGREEKKIKLKEVLNNKLLSIDDLEKKGLSFTKKEKNKE